MESVDSNPSEIQPQELLKDSREVYLRLIGVENYPQSPAELPGKFSLPKEIASPLEAVLLSSMNDYRERMQMILWDNSHQKYRFGKVWRGGSSSSGYLGAVDTIAKTNRFVSERAVVDFHTHPETRLSLFSAADIARARTLPSSAYIHLVGSGKGVFALLSTEESVSTPVSRTLEIIRAKRRLKGKDYSTLGFLKNAASVLESEGFGLYAWKTPSQIAGIEKGNMKDGIVLEKVKLD